MSIIEAHPGGQTILYRKWCAVHSSRNSSAGEQTISSKNITSSTFRKKPTTDKISTSRQVSSQQCHNVYHINNNTTLVMRGGLFSEQELRGTLVTLISV